MLNLRTLEQTLRSEIYVFPQNLDFWTCWEILGNLENARAEISRRMHRLMLRDLSYETHLGPKTKTEN